MSAHKVVLLAATFGLILSLSGCHYFWQMDNPITGYENMDLNTTYIDSCGGCTDSAAPR